MIFTTERLTLNALSPADAPFILALLNEPSFLRYIGDKGVRTEADAEQYIMQGPMASYERFGFGLYCVRLKEVETPIGICGLLRRDTLPDVDLGFAFLPDYWGKGYALEAAAATLAYGKTALGLTRIVAITAPDNEASIRLLEKLGMRFERMMQLTPDAPAVKLFA